MAQIEHSEQAVTSYIDVASFGRLPLIAFKACHGHRGDEGETIVLCYTGRFEYEPYVTWSRGPDGSCYAGHYHQHLSDAFTDFEQRG
jgi:hypothetical protein